MQYPKQRFDIIKEGIIVTNEDGHEVGPWIYIENRGLIFGPLHEKYIERVDRLYKDRLIGPASTIPKRVFNDLLNEFEAEHKDEGDEYDVIIQLFNKVRELVGDREEPFDIEAWVTGTKQYWRSR